MFKVPNGQDPYSAIGKYIRDHITAIEDIIAVIKINEVETNQLFTVDINEENYFIWENDWWEGEEDVTLIDFFPVSEAQHANQSVQSIDTISRQVVYDALMAEPLKWDDSSVWESARCHQWMMDMDVIKALPSAQPEWNNHTVACLLAEIFGDNCACNFNGIDEWLPEKCEVIDSCPNPVGVACWEQFLKHRAERITDDR